jgi:E3 ubiquitin-protein ligase RNF5
VDKDEVPEEVAPPESKEKNTVKLGTFQCVICMDDVTDLTVTHCGMFVPSPKSTSEMDYF